MCVGAFWLKVIFCLTVAVFHRHRDFAEKVPKEEKDNKFIVTSHLSKGRREL